MLEHCLVVFFVSMVPIIELRGAIPYGVGFGLPLWLTYCIAIVGNMLPVPLIYFFARRVLVWGSDKPVIGRFFSFCLVKGEHAGQKLQKRRPRPVLGAAAVCGHPPAGYRRMDGYAGRQPAGHGLQEKRAGLHGRRAAGRRHHGRAESAGRRGVSRRRVINVIKGAYTCGCTLPLLWSFYAW